MRDNLRTSIRRIVNIRTSIRRIEQLDSDKLTIVIDKVSIPEKLKMIGLKKWKKPEHSLFLPRQKQKL